MFSEPISNMETTETDNPQNKSSLGSIKRVKSVLRPKSLTITHTDQLLLSLAKIAIHFRLKMQKVNILNELSLTPCFNIP